MSVWGLVVFSVRTSEPSVISHNLSPGTNISDKTRIMTNAKLCHIDFLKKSTSAVIHCKKQPSEQITEHKKE